MESYQDLDAWKNALELIQFVYQITESLPKEEAYGLRSQLRRASNSIAMNIAEGFSRFTWADRAHKYTISRGECSEVEAGLLITVHLGFLKKDNVKEGMKIIEKERKLLSGLIKSCKQRSNAS